MQVDDSNIIDEVKDILDSGEKPIYMQYMCWFKVHQELYQCSRLMKLVVERDYLGKAGDRVMATVQIDVEVFYRHLYPLRSELQLILEKTPTPPKYPDDETPIGEPVQTTFLAMLEEETDPTLEGNEPGMTSPSSQGRKGHMELNLQLVNPALFQAHKQSVGGPFHSVSPGSLLKGLLTLTAKSQTLKDESRLLGVDMVEPDNKKKREVIVVPHGSPVLRLHRFLQQREGGIYQNGISTYIQGKYWYIYPPFHTGRFEKEQRTLTLVRLPPNRAPGLERTYNEKDGAITALLTSNAKDHNDSERLMINQGNGLIYLRADQVLEGFTEREGNTATVDRTQNLRRYGIVDRKKGTNFQVFSDTYITDNDCYEISKLAMQRGRIFEVIWQNSNPDLLYPGMPVRYLTLHGDDMDVVQEYYGTLLGCTHEMDMIGKGLSGNQHRTTSWLQLFLNHNTGEG